MATGNDVKRFHKVFRAREAKALEAFDTASAYISDGAYSSGARLLREAAAHFDAAQEARNTALNLMTEADDGR